MAKTILQQIKHWLKPRKFSVHVFIDTDDDALVIFEGNRYCFYGDDLDVHREFRTIKECYEFLRADILIPPGYKVSESLGEWIEEFIDMHQRGYDWQGVHGNQTVEIGIYEISK